MANFTTVEWKNDHVLMIDQTKLPNEEIYVKLYTAREVADAITNMIVRGAPAIGVSAAFGLALGIKQSQAKSVTQLKTEFESLTKMLFETRPTAVNLKWALDRMRKVFEACHLVIPGERSETRDPIPKIKSALEKEALQIHAEDIEINRAMGKNGEKLIRNNANIMTYCNTGALAAAWYGTALGVVRAAYENKKKFHVYVCETRPYLQGLRLTSWELQKEDIPHTVISDNMAAWLMAQKKVDGIFVGADRIAKNGDTANKIGTYNLAVLAKYHSVPFYVVAPTSTIDWECPSGKEIPIEERSAKEVTHVQGHLIGLKDVNVYNPAFDVTPSELITAIVTEKGIFKPNRFSS